MKLFVQTFGCQMNVADSGEMSAHFFKQGYTAASTQDEADVVILNTCTVRQHAEDKALSFIGRLRDWKKKDPNRVIVVAGCAAERLKDTLKKRFPHVDLVVGAKSIEQFPSLVNSYLRTDAAKRAPARTPAKPKAGGFNWFNESEEAFDAKGSRAAGKPLVLGRDGDAFVTIMRGCNYSCSYCIVPSVRGREVYREPEVILSEVRRKIAEGADSVMLLGQTVNSYWFKRKGEDGTLRVMDFSDLLRQVAAIPFVETIRFMSPHPHYMNDKLIETLGALKQIHPEIHLPAQSGSDRILKAMRRNYTRSEYLKIAAKLRKAVPALKLSTDFIVGFPGETDADFRQTMSLAEEGNFSLAYCFKYSPRKGTESAETPDDVPLGIKEERLARLLEKVETKKKTR